VLSVVWVVFYLFQRNRPEDLGLPPAEQFAADAETRASVVPAGAGESPRGALLSRAAWTNLLLIAGFYFFAKLVRYAIWSWSAFFLERNYGLTGAEANVYATAFDLAGIPGVWITGWLSDRYFQSRRADVALIMMLGMTAACGALMLFGGLGVGVFAGLLALVGFTLYGPDALMTGAGAIDVGSRRAATFTAATISGFGSLGPIVQELVIGRMYDSKGGDLTSVFGLLFGSAALAAAFCAVLVWRNRRNGSGV
jgi:OPA family sugar phosphate sensor protein UhpC-like MFS transporter